MARRPTPIIEPQRAVLSVEQMRRGINRLQKRVEEVRAFEPRSVQQRFAPEVKVLGTSIEETLGSVFGPGTIEYNRYRRASQLDAGTMAVGISSGGRPEPLSRVHQDLEKGKQSSLALLEQAIRFLGEEISEHEQAAPVAQASASPRTMPKKIFVVHGHDEAALQAVARFLERMGLEAIILREQPDQGRTIIEKFESYSAEVGFAVVLLTPDDLGAASAASTQAPRARQNVVFELGYFAGRLGRGKTCLLRKGAVEIPSDLYGVIYTDLDPNEAWKMKLVQELKAAGLAFDTNRMWL